MTASRFSKSVNRIMVAHVHGDDLLVLNQQLQRDAVRQVDGHRVQTVELATQGLQPQRRVRRVHLQQLERLEVGAAQFRVLL
jgi:hypothetical protein